MPHAFRYLVNSLDDFCLFAPPKPGKGSEIGDSEVCAQLSISNISTNAGIQQIEVSWCMKDGYGTRLIPDGSIHGAHFVQTPDFVQITGNFSSSGVSSTQRPHNGLQQVLAT
jgi:hypothetical protein